MSQIQETFEIISQIREKHKLYSLLYSKRITNDRRRLIKTLEYETMILGKYNSLNNTEFERSILIKNLKEENLNLKERVSYLETCCNEEFNRDYNPN
jgi:hypothetical protein